uniref:Reverse transcriptase domain-containing protein n=1 Tax=Tanacetum cinerariifolium TaxID=118510 RepID=A0A699GT75_TANCI|nr:hypothetical protein [Tanacetum cinerariifolium]
MEMNVRMFRPQTLADAFSLANFQEASLVVIKQKTTPLLPTPKFNNNYYANKNVNYPNKSTTMTTPLPNTQVVNKYPALPSPVPRKQLSQKEFAEKRENNICFYYDQKYVLGHKCSGQMYALEISPLEEDDDLSLEETLNEVDKEHHEESELLISECYPQISLNALSGIPTYNTMRMKSNVAKHVLHSLLDTRSTHNFLDLFTAKKLGCKMRKENVSKGYKAVGITIDEWKTTGLEPNTLYDPQLRNLLHEYGDVLDVPTELPPQRSCVHRILHKDASTMKFTLVFFDDILVYSPSMATHLHHLRQVLQVIRKHTLYAKESKCAFGTNSVEYLRHIISAQGVATDPKKIKAMQAWPVPTNIKQLRVTTNELMDAVTKLWTTDPLLIKVIQGLQEGAADNSKYTWHNQQLRRKGKWVAGSDTELRIALIKPFHNSAMGGHSGVQATTKRIRCFVFVIRKEYHFSGGGQINAIKTTPFEAMYGQPPALHVPYVARYSRVELVDKTLQVMEKAIQMLQFNLRKAQDIMKSQADKHRSDKEFEVNDWVYLKLHSYRQVTIRKGKQHELSSKFYGPFQVIAKVRKVVYKLQLPNNAKVHHVFHVS